MPVLEAITDAMRTLPLDATARQPLHHDLEGLFKCRFAFGLQPGVDDMRMAVFLNDETDTAVIWAVDFEMPIFPRTFTRSCNPVFVLNEHGAHGKPDASGR